MGLDIGQHHHSPHAFPSDSKEKYAYRRFDAGQNHSQVVL
jgi:hypothetical protein